MGFVGDAIGKVGNVLGFGGGANQYRAPGDYSSGIATAQGGALGNTAQQQFIQALQQQAAGNGPSAAQNLLQQQTQANNAGAASAVSSARGLNPALAQRLILDQQARNNQMSAQQGGLLRAQEQMGAQGMLGQAIGQQRNQDIGALSTLGGMQQGINQINAGVSGQNANISSNAWGGLLGGAGSALAGLAKGGEVPSTFALDDPMSYIGIRSVPDIFKKPGLPGVGGPPGGAVTGTQPYGADSFLTSDMGFGSAAMFDKGGAVDSAKNDTVPAMLSPGEIVLPKSVAQAEDAPDKAAAFVRAIRRQKEPEGGYGRVLQLHRELDGRMKRIEAMCAGGRVGYADGGEVKDDGKDRGTIAALAETLKHLISRPQGQPSSSPSVFDANTAAQEHNRRLQQALEGAR